MARIYKGLMINVHGVDYVCENCGVFVYPCSHCDAIGVCDSIVERYTCGDNDLVFKTVTH